MKKIFAMMAAVAALGLSSCSNEMEEAADNSVKDIKLNITVADFDLGDAQTRAVKTGWIDGDKINIWYDENCQPNPDLVIKYNGSEWVMDETASLSGKTPAASGSITYMYEGYNDLNQYTREYEEGYSITKFSEATANLTFVNKWSIDGTYDVPYTCSQETISFNINSWFPITSVQVVVTGIDNPEDYSLRCNNLQNCEGFSKNYTSWNYSGNWDMKAYGLPNDDGAAFYFLSSYGSDETTYSFELRNWKTSDRYYYDAIGTIPVKSEGKFTAIKIDKSKFGL